MTINWGHIAVPHEKSAVQKGLDWAKSHQEIIAVSGILLILVAIGVPYYLHSQVQSEKDAEGVLSLGQYYLRATVDPKNGPFKSTVERDQQALQTFQRIITDYAGTPSAKIARYYAAKSEFSLGQINQSYANFDVAIQELKGTPLGDEATLGKILCLEAQNQFSQGALLAEAFLQGKPNSFIAPEIRLNLSDLYLKTKDRAKALDQLQQVAKNYADSDWGKEAERRLKNL